MKIVITSVIFVSVKRSLMHPAIHAALRHMLGGVD